MRKCLVKHWACNIHEGHGQGMPKVPVPNPVSSQATPGVSRYHRSPRGLAGYTHNEPTYEHVILETISSCNLILLTPWIHPAGLLGCYWEESVTTNYTHDGRG